MGSQRIILLLTFACWEGYAAAQGRVEYMSPTAGSITATPIVQPCAQFVIPAVIKPLLAQEPVPEAPQPPTKPEYNDHPFYPPMQMPPIIIQDDDDDWHHLLYFLIFALKNRNYGYSGYSPPPIPYAFYPVPMGGFDRCDYNYGGSDMNYMPYPFPMPNGPMGDPNMYPGDELTIMSSGPVQPVTARDGEVTLLIRTEK